MKSDKAKTVAVSKRIAQWKGLIIDEISQVTAELLAQCEHNAKCMIQSPGTYKDTPHGHRPWGGLNIIMVGDFQQVSMLPSNNTRPASPTSSSKVRCITKKAHI